VIIIPIFTLICKVLLNTFRLFGALGPIDERRTLAITSEYVVAFFDIYLKNVPGSLLKEKSPLYPEVKFETQ